MSKDKVLEALDEFGEDVNLDAFLEKLYLLRKIERAEEDIEAGRTYSHTAAKKRLKKWLA